jgi:hypothetical protein
MRQRRPLRNVLLLANLMLLSAPYVVHGQTTRKQHDSTIKPRPAPPKPARSHRTSGKVRPQPQASSPNANDDDDGNVGENIAGACCAGLIGGAVASSEDVDPAIPEPPPPGWDDEPPPRSGTGRTTLSHLEPSGPPPMAALDEREARLQLDAAELRVRQECGIAEHDRVHVTVVFDPAGFPTEASFTPGFLDGDFHQCIETEILDCEVPAFHGAPTTIEKTLELR